MKLHSNLTRTPTRYPAPSYYGEGVYYLESEAEAAEQSAKARRPEQSEPEMPENTEGLPTCTVCGRPYTQTSRAQVTCLREPCRAEVKRRTSQRSHEAYRERQKERAA